MNHVCYVYIDIQKSDLNQKLKINVTLTSYQYLNDAILLSTSLSIFQPQKCNFAKHAQFQPEKGACL